MENKNRLEVPPLGPPVPGRTGGRGGMGGGGMGMATIFIIVGPTASGKTALSLQVARHFNTSIISADSRQCFRELNIGVAKPTAEELQEVKHYFINSNSIHDVVNARLFEDYALQAANEIFENNRYAVMVGGTGLYIKAFCEGLDEIPDADEKTRIEVTSSYKEKGLVWLQQQVQTYDPEFWAVGETLNPQRLMRALEVRLATGRSIVTFRKKLPVKRPFKIVKLGISLPLQTLYNNINSRTDEMMRDGLLEEAKQMLPFRQINALQTVGYKELFKYFDGLCTLDNAVEQIKTNTRHYAKRQLTWFKKDPSITWKPFTATNLHSFIS